MKLAYVFLAACSCIMLSVSCNNSTVSDKENFGKPNIILIYADDLGYGDISSYGTKSIATPHIDQLAANGVRFTNAHSEASTCTPSRYSLLTGQYAWRKKGSGIAPGDSPLIIDSSRTTIADVFKKADYKTAAIGKWHLGLGPEPEGPDWNGEIKPGPLELGFDSCFLIPATPDRVPTVYLENHHIANLDPEDSITVSYEHRVGDRPTGKNHPELLKMKSSIGHDQTIINGIGRIGYMQGGESAIWNDTTISKVMAGKAKDFINTNKDHAFFLYFASQDIHVPRIPAKQFRGKSGMGPRGDEILEFDWQVGQIMNTLDSLNITDNTLVIVTSDNGPVLDDGYVDGAVKGARNPKTSSYNNDLLPPHEANQPDPALPPHKPAGPLRAGKYSIFSGGTRVPFIAHWPGHTKKGMVSDALVSQVDLLASFASLTNQSFNEEVGPDSFNMLPVLLGKTSKGRDQLVLQTNGPHPLALIQGKWKYIEPDDGPKMIQHADIESGNNSKPQLYNLENDIGEQLNVAGQHPDKVKEMAKTLQQIREQDEGKSGQK